MGPVLLLIAINVLVFALPYIGIFGRLSSQEAQLKLYKLYARSNPDIRSGEYYRLLTATFLHAGPLHLLLNMYSLYLLAPAVLQGYGSFFIVLYLLSGIGGSIASYVMSPSTQSVGASGAIFGLVGAILAWALISGYTALLPSLVLTIALNLAIGQSSDFIDNWGHVGGLVTGCIGGFVLLGAGVV